jgi:hypothetical protein
MAKYGDPDSELQNEEISLFRIKKMAMVVKSHDAMAARLFSLITTSNRFCILMNGRLTTLTQFELPVNVDKVRQSLQDRLSSDEVYYLSTDTDLKVSGKVIELTRIPWTLERVKASYYWRHPDIALVQARALKEHQQSRFDRQRSPEVYGRVRCSR